MKTCGAIAVALTLVAGFGDASQAQAPGRGMGGARGNLLGNKSVQKELKLSDAQIEKADKLAQEMGESMREKFQELRELDPEEGRAKMATLQKEMAAKVQKAADEVLQPEQAKRFQQISLQAQGLQAYLNPAVQKSLMITDDQKSKIGDLGDEAREEVREIMQNSGGDRQAAQKQVAEFHKGIEAKVIALMTPEQKAMWKGMTGEPFEVKYEPMRRGGGR